jgi:hypothetical protein
MESLLPLFHRDEILVFVISSGRLIRAILKIHSTLSLAPILSNELI